MCCFTLVSTSSISIPICQPAHPVERIIAHLLTLAIVNVNDGVLVFQRLGNAADETLRALGGGVNCDQMEGTFGSRHFDVNARKTVSIGQNSDVAGLLCRIGADFVRHNEVPHNRALWVVG